MKVSLISTVYNDESLMGEFLDALFVQSKIPDEIIIVDAGSTDNTQEIIKNAKNKLPIKLIVENGVNRSKGRNIAIKNSKYDIIASLDVGVNPRCDWLEKIIYNFDDNTDVISPHTDFEPKSDFEACVDEITNIKKEDFNEKTHIPPARNLAFRKVVWEKTGGFPESIDICEDTVFGLKIKRGGYNIKILYDTMAYWHLRSNLIELFKQYRSYAEHYAILGFASKKILVKRLLSIFSPNILKSGFKCYNRDKSIKYFIMGLLIELCLRLAWLWGGLMGWMKNTDIKLDDDLISIVYGENK